MLGDISSLFWSEEVFNGAKIRDYSKGEGVNPRDFEKQIWAYDTLFVLKEFSDLDLFFKGGTCIQSLLPFDYQRFSIDLDFNIEIKDRTKEFILSKFRELNERLEKEDLSTPASETKYKKRSSEDLVYGKFYPRDYDEISGTVTFVRVFMSKVEFKSKELVYRDDLVKKKILSGIFNHILVQVNIKHQLPALKWELKDITLKIQKYPEYKKGLQFKCLSVGDLFADKLMAFKDRKEFKDLYDLGMMVKIIKDLDIETCKQKINQIFGDTAMIQDVVKGIEVSLKNKEYSKHIHSLPKEVVPLIRDRMFYTKLIDVIEGI
ncbi:MAG: nucleotidyl transferase AbiEii/AbiGii toxin family protein [Halobacteriota archaeon]